MEKQIAEGYFVTTEGEVISTKDTHSNQGEPHVLKLHSFKNSSYVMVDLTFNGKRKHFFVHRLVAQAFIPNPLNKPEVNHINGDKTDNRVENLEWCTRSENQQHACRTGLQKVGEKSLHAKLTNDQATWIRAVYTPYSKEFGAAALSRKFNVSPKTILNAATNLTYKTN